MKALTLFLITATILLLIAAGAIGYVWIKLQNTLDARSSTSEGTSGVSVETTDTPVVNIETIKADTTIPTEGIKIDTSSVSEEQKAIAEKLGIDIDNIIITPEMVSCAERKLGSQRMQEIMEGSSPTTLEGISLLGCL